MEEVGPLESAKQKRGNGSAVYREERVVHHWSGPSIRNEFHVVATDDLFEFVRNHPSLHAIAFDDEPMRPVIDLDIPWTAENEMDRVQLLFTDTLPRFFPFGPDGVVSRVLAAWNLFAQHGLHRWIDPFSNIRWTIAWSPADFASQTKISIHFVSHGALKTGRLAALLMRAFVRFCHFQARHHLECALIVGMVRLNWFDMNLYTKRTVQLRVGQHVRRKTWLFPAPVWDARTRAWTQPEIDDRFLRDLRLTGDRIPAIHLEPDAETHVHSPFFYETKPNSSFGIDMPFHESPIGERLLDLFARVPGGHIEPMRHRLSAIVTNICLAHGMVAYISKYFDGHDEPRLIELDHVAVIVHRHGPRQVQYALGNDAVFVNCQSHAHRFLVRLTDSGNLSIHEGALKPIYNCSSVCGGGNSSLNACPEIGPCIGPVRRATTIARYASATLHPTDTKPHTCMNAQP